MVIMSVKMYEEILFMLQGIYAFMARKQKEVEPGEVDMMTFHPPCWPCQVAVRNFGFENSRKSDKMRFAWGI
jgi:hypothetical protein